MPVVFSRGGQERFYVGYALFTFYFTSKSTPCVVSSLPVLRQIWREGPLWYFSLLSAFTLIYFHELVGHGRTEVNETIYHIDILRGFYLTIDLVYYY